MSGVKKKIKAPIPQLQYLNAVRRLTDSHRTAPWPPLPPLPESSMPPPRSLPVLDDSDDRSVTDVEPDVSSGRGARAPPMPRRKPAKPKRSPRLLTSGSRYAPRRDPHPSGARHRPAPSKPRSPADAASAATSPPTPFPRPFAFDYGGLSPRARYEADLVMAAHLIQAGVVDNGVAQMMAMQLRDREATFDRASRCSAREFAKVKEMAQATTSFIEQHPWPAEQRYHISPTTNSCLDELVQELDRAAKRPFSPATDDEGEEPKRQRAGSPGTAARSPPVAPRTRLPRPPLGETPHRPAASLAAAAAAPAATAAASVSFADALRAPARPVPTTRPTRVPRPIATAAASVAPARAVTRTAAATTAARPAAAAAAATVRPAAHPDVRPAAAAASATTPGPTTQQPKPRYPPIVVEHLPNWTAHIKELTQRLGHAPNVRPYGKGLRFLPRSDDEFRAVQRLLADLEQSKGVQWHCYQLSADRDLKLALRGLPADTPTEEIVAALAEQNVQAEYVRPIHARRGRPGCIFYVQAVRTFDVLPRVYGITELLCMPGVKIEAWRGRKGPAQCHRCQLFRHASRNCHRQQACVRCGDPHSAADCPRPREDPPTCANCKGSHTANSVTCPVFRREARNRRAGTAALTAGARRVAPTKPRREEEPSVQEHAGPTLMAPARDARQRRDPASSPRRRRKGKKRRKKEKADVESAARREAAQPTPLPARQEPVAPAVAAPQAGGKKVKPTSVVDPLTTAIVILEGVLQALRNREDATPVIIDGLNRLLAAKAIAEGPRAP